MRSTSASSGSSAAQTDAHSSAPCTSPDGEETATSASSSRAARCAISAARLLDPRIHDRPAAALTVFASARAARDGDHRPPPRPPRSRARRIESVLTPGINALKTFDPPLRALEGATFTDVRRRGKLLLLEADTATTGR